MVLSDGLSVRYADIVFPDEEYEVTSARYIPGVLLTAQQGGEGRNSEENDETNPEESNAC